MNKQRRKRVNKIKRVLRIFVAAAIIIPVITCIVLAFKVRSLTRSLEQARSVMETQARALSSKGIITEPPDITAEGNDGIGEYFDSTSSPFDAGTLANEETAFDETDPYYIYLTFDDGPSENTENILTILREYNVKATFFVNGKESDEMRQLYKRIADAGHTIGMHSYSHVYSRIYSSDKAFEEDMNRIRELVKTQSGINPVFYRFPGGSSNNIASSSKMKSYIKILHDNGVEYVDWNIDSGDGKGNGLSADEIVNNVFNNFGRYHTNVVLLHDGYGHGATVEALPRIIERARNMGAELEPLTLDTAPVQHLK